jgi:hypothetical protein
MRTNKLVRALFLILVGTLGTTSAQAQSAVAPIIAHHPRSADASIVGSTENDLVDAGVKSSATTSLRREKNSTVNIIPAETAKAVQEASRNALKNFAATPKAVSLLDEHKLNVKVGYDARPVGGILTVRVSISPTFSGIGVSTRPATSRSVSLAVDEFSQTVVDQMVSDLTDEIQAEFKSMNEASASNENAQVN